MSSPAPTAGISYSEACQHPDLFGPWFAGPTWSTWRVLDKALFGDPLTEAELAIFAELTGRPAAPMEMSTEAWLIMGRRSGKDVKAASIVVYLATIGAERFGYRKRLVRGERGVVQLLAVDRDQAKVCLGYIRAMLEQPLLAQLVENDTADTIELTNALAIEVTTNDRRRVRGRTVVAAVLDEVAHWRSETTVNPDTEVYAAVKPAMATIPNAMLIGISSPYARRGLLWTKHQGHYGKEGNLLVARAPTWVMNPTLPRDGEFLTQAFADDPVSASGEFGAEFRSDLEAFVSLDVVKACITAGVRERGAIEKISYVAFVDPSGGSSDSMTLAVAHREGDRVVLDCVRERRAPFSPEDVVGEFANTLKSYGIGKVTGDRYAGEWPREAFRRRGVHYEVAPKPKSDLYRDALPLLNAGSAVLLDDDVLVKQLVSLERRTARGGREFDRPPPEPA